MSFVFALARFLTRRPPKNEDDKIRRRAFRHWQYFKRRNK